MTRKIAVLTTAGSPIAGAIDLLLKQPGAGRAADVLTVIAADIKSGATIAQAFQKHELLFGAFFCSIITQGESSGNAGGAFLKLSEYYEKRDAFQKKITRLLKYPFIILLGTAGCLITLLLFLIPRGMQKFLTGPENSPLAITLAASITSLFQVHSFEVAIISAMFMVLLFCLWLSNRKVPWLTSCAWYIPIFGDVLRKNSLQRFSLALFTLLSSGFNPAHALTISARELRNSSIEKRILHSLIETINDSKTIFLLLKELSIFPLLIIEMAKDEKRLNNNLDHFKKIIAFYQDEVEAAFNVLAIIIGPVFVSVAGLLGLGVLMSL